MVKWQRSRRAMAVWTSSWMPICLVCACKTDCLWTWMYMTWPNGAVWLNWEAISMDNGCAAVAFPDFTRGEWNVTKVTNMHTLHPEDENASMESKAFTAKLKEQGAKEWAKEAKKEKEINRNRQEKMCRKSLCMQRQPNSSGTFFMPSEQQRLDFIENQKDVTGILIISGQSTSTSTVSNSIRHAILSKVYRRVKRNWNTADPHTVSRRLFQAHSGRAIRHADGISKGIHLHHP